MRRPHADTEADTLLAATNQCQGQTGQRSRVTVRTCNGVEVRTSGEDYDSRSDDRLMPRLRGSTSAEGISRRGPMSSGEGYSSRGEGHPDIVHLDNSGESMCSLRRSRPPYSKEIMDAIDSVTFIAEHLKNEDRDSSVSVHSH